MVIAVLGPGEILYTYAYVWYYTRFRYLSAMCSLSFIKATTIVYLDICILYLCVQKRQTLVDILDLVHAHAAVVRLAQLLAGDDFQQLQQLYAVRQIDEQIFHLHLGLRNTDARRRTEGGGGI